MPFVYNDVNALEGTEKVGGGSCVGLLQHYASGIGQASGWTEGAVVMGNTGLPRGTAIATFVDGRYPNGDHGNHGAFYLYQDAGGIYVMDQWTGANKPTVSKRYIPRLSRNRPGFVRPSDNADAFSVIEPGPTAASAPMGLAGACQPCPTGETVECQAQAQAEPVSLGVGAPPANFEPFVMPRRFG